MNPPFLMRRLLLALLPIAALLLTACGGDDETAGTKTARTKTTDTPGFASAYGDTTVYALPAEAAPLAANAADAGRIIGDGTSALEKRLATLKGFPVVVNQWASWCGPCAAEFPFFVKAADPRAFGATVAFVGVDSRDDRASAKAFLRDQAAGFPSVFDPDGEAAIRRHALGRK